MGDVPGTEGERCSGMGDRNPWEPAFGVNGSNQLLLDKPRFMAHTCSGSPLVQGKGHMHPTVGRYVEETRETREPREPRTEEQREQRERREQREQREIRDERNGLFASHHLYIPGMCALAFILTLIADMWIGMCHYRYCRKGENIGGGYMNFDTIGAALLTVFVSATLEGWVDVMYALQVRA